MKKITSTLIALLLLCTTAAAQLGPSLGPAGPGSGGSVPSASITVGTTSVSGGTNTRVLFDNNGTLGEYTISGTGNVCMTTNCVMTTPNLGTPSAVILTNGTGLPISSGVSGLGSGVATALGLGTNANGGVPTYSSSTWTPTLSTDATPGTPAYTTQVGSYEQIGRTVIARFNIVLSGWTGSPTGNALIINLPLASTTTANDFGYCWVGVYSVAGLLATTTGITGRVQVNSSFAQLFSGANTTTAGITAAQLGSTPTLQGECVYRTN